MSPAQRQKLISTPLKRKWTVAKNPIKNKNEISSGRTLVKETPMTKSAQSFTQINNKNYDKQRGSHLYRQGTSLSELRIYGNKKQFNPKFTMKGHLDGVRSLAISNDNSILISGSEDCSLKLWDVKDFDKNLAIQTGIEPYITLRDHKGPIFSIASQAILTKSLLETCNICNIPSNLLFSAGAEVIYLLKTKTVK